MKLLLRKDIANLGLCGEVVEVSAGHARNYLLPHHLALAPTKANLKIIDEDKKRAAAERERRYALLKAECDRLAGAEVTISAACNPEGHLYGSVGPREISHALMEEGYSVHPDQIKMSANIKQVGAQEVSVVLADDLNTTIKVWVVAERAAGNLEGEEEGAQGDAKDVAGDSTTVGPGSGETDAGSPND
jgi:large subunit ribosomal protein L9